MDEITSDFYITLPSNSSIEHFPDNTQSSFRTKLSAPLVLSADDWLVGLSEIFISKSWYNIDGHNNAYSVTLDVEERVPRSPDGYTIDIRLETDMSISDFCASVNNEIVKRLKIDKVTFQPREDTVNVELALGYEVRILKETSPKLLDILQHPPQNLIFTKSRSFKYKAPSGNRTREKIIIINNHIISMQEILLPTNRIKHTRDSFQSGKRLAEDLNENIRILDFDNKVKFSYSPEKREMYFIIDKNISLYMDQTIAPTLMKKLNLDLDHLYVSDTHTFLTNPTIEAKPGESMKMIVPVYIDDLKKTRKKIDFKLSPGLYKTSEGLFSVFQHVKLTLLPNMKVSMRVLPNHELNLSKGLAEMLGFANDVFLEGEHIGEYPLALDAGITEIYVYSDLVSSHLVGDTFAPLLRVVPARSESHEEIVKQYDRPLYFPLKNKFLETILIELRTSFGELITFTSGKTHVVLSFRRKKL